MRGFLPVVVAGFAAVLAVCAGDCVPPRASSSDYPVRREAQNATIAAALVPPDLAKKMFPPEVNKNFVVVEVAVFPLEGQIADVDSFDFGLKFSAGEVSHPRVPEEIVSMWMEQSAPQPPSKVGVTAETGVVYTSGNDPATGRSHGWGTYSGVGVGSGDPAPPRPPSTDPRDVEANLRAKALPEGPAVRPVAGYLYFPLPSKKHKSGPLELQYLKDGVLVSLPIPAK
jgi:hypothetical protein